MIIYKIRVILDEEEDVFRDFEVSSDSSLICFHETVVKAFGLSGKDMASFYEVDDLWDQGKEFPIFPMGDGEACVGTLNSVLRKKNDKLIYVYDYLAMWTFYVELIATCERESGKTYPNVIFAKGEMPETPPERSFVVEKDDDAPDTFSEFDGGFSQEDLEGMNYS